MVRQNAIASTIESCGVPFSFDLLFHLLYPTTAAPPHSGASTTCRVEIEGVVDKATSRSGEPSVIKREADDGSLQL